LIKIIHLISPKTKGHKISIRELKDGTIKVIHRFPNNEAIRYLSESYHQTVNEYINMGYIVK